MLKYKISVPQQLPFYKIICDLTKQVACCMLHYVCYMQDEICFIHIILLFTHYKPANYYLNISTIYNLYILHDACCMLHAACFMLHDTCCMLHAACCMLHVACCILHEAKNMLHAYPITFFTHSKLKPYISTYLHIEN